MVTKQNQGNEIATDLYYGGMIRDEIGGFHPGKFFSGLLKRAEEAGVIVISDLPVLEIENEKKGKKIVITSKGQISAGKVIIATNAYTGTKYKVGKFLRKRLVPAKSAIIVTEELGVDYVKKLMPKLRMYGDTSNLYSYFRTKFGYDIQFLEPPKSCGIPKVLNDGSIMSLYSCFWLLTNKSFEKDDFFQKIDSFSNKIWYKRFVDLL